MKNIGWIFLFLCFSGCMGCEKVSSIDYVTLNVSPTCDTLYLGDTLALHVDFPSAVTLSDGTLAELQNGYFYIYFIEIREVEIDSKHNNFFYWASANVKRYSNMKFYGIIPNSHNFDNAIPCQDGQCSQRFKMKLMEVGNFLITIYPYRSSHEAQNNYYKSNGEKSFNVYFSSLPFVPQKIATTGSVTYYPFTVVDRPSN